MTADLGLAAAIDVGDDGRLTFGKLEPLVAFMQETPLEKLQPRVAEKIAKGTDLKTLLAAAGLAGRSRATPARMGAPWISIWRC